jgi:CRISPR/Cas system-associated exonuclease Cas4 (RecB family)
MFKRQVIEKKPVIETDVMLAGSCFHAYVVKLTKNIIKNGEYEENIWDEIIDQKGDPYSDDVIAKSKELWNTYRKRFFNNLNPNIIVKTEQRFAIDGDFCSDDWFSKKVFFRGIFDRIDINENDNTIRIIDYKTGNKKKADTFQGQVYVWLLSKVVDLSDYAMIVVAFEHVNSKSEYYQVKYSDLPIIEQRIFETISEIENDESFHPKQNPMCTYCSYNW